MGEVRRQQGKGCLVLVLQHSASEAVSFALKNMIKQGIIVSKLIFYCLLSAIVVLHPSVCCGCYLLWNCCFPYFLCWLVTCSRQLFREIWYLPVERRQVRLVLPSITGAFLERNCMANVFHMSNETIK